MTISVALCTHNGRAFVDEQVASILTQSTPVDEIVLSDDASSDGTVDRVRELVRREQRDRRPRLNVLLNDPALGVVQNFAQAVAASTGDLVLLCDQDDRWRPDKVATLAAAFAAGPNLLLAASDADLVDGDGESLGRTLSQAQGVSHSERAAFDRGAGLEVLLRRSLMTGATVAFRRSLLDVALPFPDGWVHDEWLAVVAAGTGSVALLPGVLGDYRQHSSNQVGVGRGRRDKLRLLLQPRDDRNRRLLQRSRTLLQRLEQAGAPAQSLQLVREKSVHEEVRCTLPRSRPLRIVPVVREMRRGGYDRFGLGRKDVARDLVQPGR